MGQPDAELFPPSFLRLLGVAASVMRRIAAASAEGGRAGRGHGGRFLFRGHRAYRPGDDLRRVDWNVEARLGRLEVRQFDPEKDVRTEVWLDGSASMGPFGGRTAALRAAALAVATGLGPGGRARLGLLRGGALSALSEVKDSGALRDVLLRLGETVPTGRADLAAALPRLVKQVPRQTRLVIVSDLLTRADPGILAGLAGRGIRGTLLALRIPEVVMPAPGLRARLVDAESGHERVVEIDAALAGRVAARAREHTDLWRRHAARAGLDWLPFTPAVDPETLLRRLAKASA